MIKRLEHLTQEGIMRERGGCSVWTREGLVGFYPRVLIPDGKD